MTAERKKLRCRHCQATDLVWWDRDGWMPGVWVDYDVLDYDNSGEHCEESPDDEHHPYDSQSARDAQAMGYGDKSYWDYLDEAAKGHRDSFAARGDSEQSERMMTQTLSEALMGNDGD